uniref:Cadherin domain-containing protein n=1 Tax=Xiphophorus couchianus TaxID=32473 RepID=A0A3B5L7Y2_9TELE
MCCLTASQVLLCASVTVMAAALPAVVLFVILEFDDCAGNEDVSFEVSDPSFHVDGDLNLVPHRDMESCGPVLLVHGFGSQADDQARLVALLVPPIIVTENQRAPFPLRIGKVILTEKPVHHIFRLTGPGADQYPKGLFTIDIDTGDVSVSRSLDREAIDSYQLEVSTTDFSGNVIEGPVILVVTVIDQNDNRPIFKESRYTGEVLEGSPTGQSHTPGFYWFYWAAMFHSGRQD